MCSFFFFFAVCVSLCVHLFSIGVLSLKIVSLRFTAFDFPPTIWFHASIISTRSKGKQNTCNLHAVISADKSEGFLLFVCLFVLFFTSNWNFALVVHINSYCIWYKGESWKRRKINEKWTVRAKSFRGNKWLSLYCSIRIDFSFSEFTVFQSISTQHYSHCLD